METPRIYSRNIKKGIITRDMLETALYSVNKRAKNCRDKEACYRRSPYRYKRQCVDKYNYEKARYYGYKDDMLTLLSPTCIHRCVKKNRLGENVILYFLLYDFGCEHTFHHPISESELKNYPDLEIITIDSNFHTKGASIEDLVSVQFVTKLVDLIKSGNYTFVA